MRRLARWTLNALTVLSPVLCAATCVMWMRSFWAWDEAHYCAQDGHEFKVESGRGAMYFGWGVDDHPVNRGFLSGWAGPAWEPWEGQWQVSTNRLLAIRLFHPTFKGDHSPHHVLIISDWLVLLMTAALPTHAYLTRRRVRHRRAAGDCPRCGYHLRGNVSGVCPECGTSIAKATSPPAESFR